ncbi:hypothetical protein HO173_006039 [Letharia columbiana]|uniref:Uncharacterized protein n=1 Tax=Letharia columbiana TaxID=112416 RepID=A0A8H6FW53_9LECA|nr:uncharacterized protein HO173_006039 [Letharia columbiana]KAF6235844.1 hypothetical protein HO173_006039 [Letharia columbiana]
MLTFNNVWRWGISWGILVNSITARKLSGNGVHPRHLNVSGLLPPVSSLSLDPASFSSLDPASTLLPQAPADYCGLCIIEAPGGIRLVYWEPDGVGSQGNVTANANPTQPYTTVDNGFTYTSPSVYVIYSELQATVSATGQCDLSASGDPVGPSYAAKTIGYSSRFLAYGTVTNPGPNCDEQYIEGGFHTIDFSELYYTPIVTSTVYKPGCTPYANPRLSLPADLIDVVPAWETCQPLFYGAFDPPSILTKASGLAPAQASPAAVTPPPPPVPALPAVAQATPTAGIPPATIAPNNAGQMAGANDPPASVIKSNDITLLNGNTHEVVATPAASPEDSDPTSQEAAAANNDPSGQLIAPTAAVVANNPTQTPASGTDPDSQKVATGNDDPSGQVPGSAAAVIVKSPVQTPASAANIVVAQGKTLTENGPSANIGGKAAVYSSGSVYVDSTPVAVPTSAQVTPANIVVAQGQTLTEGGSSANFGGKAAVYSAGSIYLDSSTPIAVPKAEDTNVVVAQGQTLTENGLTASIGGKAAVYSAGSLYYDSTPIPIPKASPTNVVVAQGQTLTENGPSAFLGGKTALYKAGSIYYDSTPVAIPTSTQGQQNHPPVVVAGVTFAPTIQTPSSVVTNGITFAPWVEKASPVVAGGITFAPILQSVGEDTHEPVVAGGITFQPSNVQSSNAVAMETPAPLSVGRNPVLKAVNGDLIVAGTTISQGSTTSLLGHVIVANSDNVVLDGTTHSLAPVTAYPVETPTSTPLEIANEPVLKAANGDLVIAGSTVSQGSMTRLLGHAISVGLGNIVLDGTTHAFGPVTAHPLETPTPFEIANQPVMEAANGGLVLAGVTIPQGSQIGLFGHVVSVGADNLVEDGKTLAFAANTKVAGQQSVASLVYGTSNIETTLIPGVTYSSSGHIITYTGSIPSVLTEATSSVIGTTTVPQQASALPSQVFVEASVYATPEQLFVEVSPSALQYVLNGKTATAAAPSDVPLGGLILAGFGAVPGNGSTPMNSSVLPSIVLVNSTVTSIPTSQAGSSPSSTSMPGNKASPSRPAHGTGPRVMSWSRVFGNYFVVLGYILGIALIM